MSDGTASVEARRPTTILICEDDPSIRALIRIVLPGTYRFIEAGDGVEAVGLARAEQPDLVLLDLMLPRKSGLEVLAWLRQDPRFSATPVVAISAFAGDAEQLAVAAAGADRFLSKPFDPDELSATVEELLTERR
jgi:CheY-like chemotaxis protein